ncbi:MAG: phosphatase PAP2 family protein [Parabacteroides sp.]|uniref:Phosphatase PAP2 family protein n=1 Tax=Parabacteroides faecalis TaxID=2924040 RepID=A0ABT0BWD9_9BACT|nr:phosphatase PAP2 family protein [Parabacteroides faecalis]MCI7286803.1 phosphatase PAP2 family protein [Parabacteroides sp.]MDY6254229.1 phosphatase PAP2 family protein [Bacteroidales bacterium]MCI7359266.1 phosphatase PAP2 family protein [Parabacteroides sp.]MCJ2379095.1 phosphatase PAP2 family protein [Parabacteroides faecalis]MDD7561399.1 phosphatase PAP2 family protein [Parabacteroides sp.]
MLEQILVWERDLFLTLNGCHTPYWDEVMWLYSGKAVWLPLAVFIILVLAYKKNWKEVLFILLGIALTITLCDQFASGICKPLFHRFRPTHHPDFMDAVKTVFDYRGGRYGFISSHAANAFGFAMFMTLLLRNKLLGITLFIWATINAYTRIYLGVHFISDIIPGMLSGLLFGFVAYHIYMWARYHFLSASVCPFLSDPSYMYQGKRVQAITIAVWLMFVFLLCFSGVLISFIR